MRQLGGADATRIANNNRSCGDVSALRADGNGSVDGGALWCELEIAAVRIDGSPVLDCLVFREQLVAMVQVGWRPAVEVDEDQPAVTPQALVVSTVPGGPTTTHVHFEAALDRREPGVFHGAQEAVRPSGEPVAVVDALKGGYAHRGYDGHQGHRNDEFNQGQAATTM